MIPKLIHFIWLGCAPVPDYFLRNMEGWQSLHPDWEVMLWKDDSAEKVVKNTVVEELYRQSKSWAGKSDILRLLILHVAGGIYMDGDMEPRKNMEPILEPHIKCFACWEQDGERINNAIIGSVSHHPSIIAAIVNLPGHVARLEHREAKKDAAHLTGPYYLNQLWWHDARVHKFPKKFFYPYDWWQPYDAALPHADAYGIHRWEATWIGEVVPPQKWLGPAGSHPVSVFAVPIGGGQDRMEWMLGGVAHQSIHRKNILIGGATSLREFRLNPMGALLSMFAECYNRGVQRIILCPTDHVLDRDTVEMHYNLPSHAIGTGLHRMYSSHRFYKYPGRDDSFPFAVLAANSKLAGPARAMSEESDGSPNDLGEVVSFPVLKAVEVLQAFSGDRVGDYAATIRRIAEAMIRDAGCAVLPVLTSYSTKLCRFLVDAPVGYVPPDDETGYHYYYA